MLYPKVKNQYNTKNDKKEVGRTLSLPKLEMARCNIKALLNITKAPTKVNNPIPIPNDSNHIYFT
jgi:hypothetical protein